MQDRKETNTKTDWLNTQSRQTDRQTDRETDRQTDVMTDGQTGTQTDRHKGKQTDRQIDRQTDKHEFDSIFRKKSDKLRDSDIQIDTGKDKWNYQNSCMRKHCRD